MTAIIKPLAILSVFITLFAQAKAQNPHFELTSAQAQQLMQAGELTSEKLVTYYLERIAKYDDGEDGLNAVVQLNANAIARAKTLDQERASGKVRSVLHGIPVLVKDNINTADGMANTAGSLALAEYFPNSDAPLITALREAGAIILGKTNLSEWANFRSERSSSGWSGLWGQTKNPYDKTRSPCGSSSGTGAAIAADFAILGIGTETDGSVVCPSAFNGIVGFKPSLGVVSAAGIIPIAHSQDTAGAMTRSVADAAVLLNLMASESEDNQQTILPDLTKHLLENGLKGKRIGVVRSLAGRHELVDKRFDEALEILRDRDAVIVDDLSLTRGDMGQHEYTVLLYEFKHDLNAFLEDAGLELTLADLIAFNIKNKDIEMPYFQQEIFELANAKGTLQEEAYLTALAESKRLAGAEGIDALLKKHNLDLLVAPTTHAATKIDLVNGEKYLGGASSFAAIAGYPHITVPMGYVHGLPVGLSMFTGYLGEPVLVEAAYDFEQASRLRKAPTLD